jgi:hypothetical protein
MKRFGLLAVAAWVCGCSLTGTARAESITYTEQVTASGSLNGTSFTNAQVTLTFTGDTVNVTSLGGGLFVNQTGTTTVAIDGIGMDTLKSPAGAFVSQSLSEAGFLGGSATISATTNSVFATYDLTTSITASGSPVGSTGFGFPTSLGTLTLTGFGGTSTFTATRGAPTATPEPASLTLLAVGMLCMAGYGYRLHRRRWRAAAP